MKLIDMLRGSYIRSPHWVKRGAAPILSLLPYSLRYGKTYLELRKLISRSEDEADFVEQYQLQLLQSMIADCNNSSSYYQELFKRVFSRMPDASTFSIDDLKSLPVLSREVVQSNAEKLLVTSVDNVDIATTSGSSGEPLKFYLDRDRSVREWAFVHHLWQRIGYSPRHRRATLRGVVINNVDKKPWEFDPAINELRLSPFHLVPEVMDRYLELIADYHVDFIHGYPSAVSMLASHAKRIGWSPPAKLIGVFPISESFLPHQRALIEEAFGGIKIMMCYGLSEKSAIAGELPDSPGVYEFEPLYGITELVNDDGFPITAIGSVGRIVSTGFVSTAMPLLRYDTGDIAELVQLPSKENCYRMRVKNIRSRWAQEFVVGRNNALISISAINIHSPVYARIQAFQFHQHTPGEVSVKVVPLPGEKKEDIEPFVSEIQAKVGESVKFSLEITDALALNKRGKRRFIIQKLDTNSTISL